MKRIFLRTLKIKTTQKLKSIQRKIIYTFFDIERTPNTIKTIPTTILRMVNIKSVINRLMAPPSIETKDKKSIVEQTAPSPKR